MKLQMIGAHMKPRKSKTSRSITSSYKNNIDGEIDIDQKFEDIKCKKKNKNTVRFSFYN